MLHIFFVIIQNILEKLLEKKNKKNLNLNFLSGRLIYLLCLYYELRYRIIPIYNKMSNGLLILKLFSKLFTTHRVELYYNLV